jgi:hypothetical protein
MRWEVPADIWPVLVSGPALDAQSCATKTWHFFWFARLSKRVLSKSDSRPWITVAVPIFNFSEKGFGIHVTPQ